MESLGHGAFPDGEWESFSKMFSAEELDFTPQFLGQPSFLLEHDHHEGLNYDPRAPSTFCPTSEATDSLLYSLGNINSNLQYISQERSNGSNCSSSFFIANPCSHDNYYFGDAKHIPVANHDVCVMDEKNIGSFFPAFPDFVMGETVCINEDHMSPHEASPEAIANIPGNELLLKRKFDASEYHTKEEDKTNCNQSSENTKKKPRVSRNVQKSTKKNVKSKKNQKLSQEEESNAGRDVQSSSGCSSDDDNASQETNGGEPSESKDSAALNLSGKMRASRGSATDPQSLYARKRRERINERLRILQGLVPNGTKVDISTMLEEAVHYVKFLQLQIKLLSSDDMWMYAPIAYNGMDIGLISQKISPPL